MQELHLPLDLWRLVGTYLGDEDLFSIQEAMNSVDDASRELSVYSAILAGNYDAFSSRISKPAYDYLVTTPKVFLVNYHIRGTYADVTGNMEAARAMEEYVIDQHKRRTCSIETHRDFEQHFMMMGSMRVISRLPYRTRPELEAAVERAVRGRDDITVDIADQIRIFSKQSSRIPLLLVNFTCGPYEPSSYNLTHIQSAGDLDLDLAARLQVFIHTIVPTG